MYFGIIGPSYHTTVATRARFASGDNPPPDQSNPEPLKKDVFNKKPKKRRESPPSVEGFRRFLKDNLKKPKAPKIPPQQ